MSPHLATRVTSETGDPLLLTPGPLTTSKTVKEAMIHDWGSRDAAFVGINRDVLAFLPKIVNGEEHVRDRPDAGLGHLRGRGDAHDLRAARRQGADPDQRRLWPAGQADPRDRAAQVRDPRDARGHAAGSRRRSKRILAPIRQHHACFRRALRDHERHPQPDRGDRRRRRALRQAAADRRHERLRRHRRSTPPDPRSTRSPPPPTSASRACPGSASSSAASEALAARQGQRDHPGARPLRPVAEPWRRPASTASRRRSTSSSLSIRRCEEF